MLASFMRSAYSFLTGLNLATLEPSDLSSLMELVFSESFGSNVCILFFLRPGGLSTLLSDNPMVF